MSFVGQGHEPFHGPVSEAFAGIRRLLVADVANTSTSESTVRIITRRYPCLTASETCRKILVPEYSGVSYKVRPL